MATELRRKLIKQLFKKGTETAHADPVMKQLLRENEGETMLFYIEDLKAPFGFEISSNTLNFLENPDLNKAYNLVASCNENTLIHILRGLDPMDAFFYGYIEVNGKGWFKRVLVLKRILKLGEDRGLKQKVVA